MDTEQNTNERKKIQPMLLVIALVIGLVVVGGIVWASKDSSTSNNSSSSDKSSPSQESANTAHQDGSAEAEEHTHDESDANLYTTEVVAKHSTKSDCWTIIDGAVYDVTSYVAQHPGGTEILRACGADGTTLFQQRKTTSGEVVGSGSSHSSSAKSQLESLKIGSLKQ